MLGGTIRAANARYRLPRVLAVVIIAFAAAAIVARANDRASSAAALWEVSDAPVLVAVRDIPAGGIIEAAAVTLQAVPVGLLPPDAMHDLPPSSRSTTGLVAGEILRSARTDPRAASAITALLPCNHLTFSVLADERIISIGDTVRLYDLATGSVAVRSAEVLVVDEGRITVAVAEIDAPRLIAAISAAGVVAAITPSAATSDW